VSLGGSLGRREATGRGVFVTAREAARHLGLDLAGARVTVQGFGNVGSVAARLFHQAGARIVALQNQSGGIYREQGLDIADLQRHLLQGGRLGDYPHATALGTEEFWDVETDIVIPAAMENQIDAARATRLRTRMVVEGANGPTNPEADDIFTARNILVVPDVLANAGGVTVSYFEWVQDFNSYFWSEDEINARLETIMGNAFHAIWEMARERRVSLRTAAFIIACTRVLDARAQRGLYP
jgi:glutamate dehydrogenase (NAD(P)+)